MHANTVAGPLSRIRLAATGLPAALLLAAVASAAPPWSDTGPTAAAPHGQAIIVRASIPPGIAPGDHRTVRLTASNTGSSTTAIKTVQLIDISADAGHPDCVTADFRMADVPQRATIPAGADNYRLASGTLIYHNTDADQNGCQGATLTLTLSSN